MTRGEHLLHVLAMVGVVILMGAWIFSITAGPMMRNYDECGTIFLCSAQPN